MLLRFEKIMIKIGILSDTHGYFNPLLRRFFEESDELWHAGDWGSPGCFDEISKFKPVKGVYGNIDGQEIRKEVPEILNFQIEELSVCMMHVGGYPGNYSPAFKHELLKGRHIDIMVCGHSHILKVMRDKKNNLMHFNPGAAGKSGFHLHHRVRGRIEDLLGAVPAERLPDVELRTASTAEPRTVFRRSQPGAVGRATAIRDRLRSRRGAGLVGRRNGGDLAGREGAAWRRAGVVERRQRLRNPRTGRDAGSERDGGGR